MSWTFVTVTYNSAQHLTRYWSDLSEHHPDVEWIVVDNASRDSSAELARALGAQVVELPHNRGFSYANNRGLELVKSQRVLFLNPDIFIPRDTDLRALERWPDALVAPRLLNTDGSVQDNARGLPFLSRKVRNRLGRWVDPHPEYVRTDVAESTYIAWAMGAALGGAAAAFREIGAWNEDYFLYYEDHEIGLRAWSRGLRVVYEPAVTLEHEWQRATTALDRAAWRFELDSMRTFYRAHPALLTSSCKLTTVLELVRDGQLSPA